MALQKVAEPGAPNKAEMQRALAANIAAQGRAETTHLGDPVTNPEHYTEGGIETIDFLKAKLSEDEFWGLCVGNIIKYVTRAKHKNGIQDIKKAQQYCEFLISQYK